MIKRTIEISSAPTTVSLSSQRLCIAVDDREKAFVPLEDLGTLVLANRQIMITAAALDACAQTGVAVVVCDQRFTPSAMLQPLVGASLQARSVALQAALTEPQKKGLWRQVVKAKIMAQAKTLAETGEENGAMLAWAKKVRSGDTANHESRAAAFYWPRMFGADFRRDRYGLPPNGPLNYGYAIVRSSVARAIVGAGLHPSFGIHHCNQYNPFLLADDLMEPLRPLIDKVVWELWKENPERDVDKESKISLLGILGESLISGSGLVPFEVALARYTASFRRALEGNKRLAIPTW